jgi:YggT family protein
MRGAMHELLNFINYLFTLYGYVVIGYVVLGWLLAFSVVNGRNPFVQSLWTLFQSVTEPLLGAIRRVMPNLGAVDISPLILLLGLFFVQSVIIPNLHKMF